MIRLIGLLMGVAALALPAGADVAPHGANYFSADSMGLLKTLSPRVGTPQSIAFSPDGSRLAVGGMTGSVAVYSTSTWKPVLKTADRGCNALAVAFSPDGKRLAIGLSENKVVVYSFAKSAIVTDIATGVIGCIAWSSRKNDLFVGGVSASLKRYDAESGREIRSYGTEAGEAWYGRMTVSQDGTRICAGRSDGGILVWNTDTGAELAHVDNGLEISAGHSFSPDGKKLAYGGNDSSVVVYDIAAKSSETFPKAHAAHIFDVEFSPDGRFLVSASEDTTVRVWNVASKKEVAMLKHHSGPVFQLAVSRDGKYTASLANDYQVKIWGRVKGGMTAIKPKGFLGVGVQTDSSGCRITRIEPSTAAEKAGIQENEVILKVNGETVTTHEEAIQVIGTSLEGDEVEVELKSDAGTTRTLKVKLGKRP